MLKINPNDFSFRKISIKPSPSYYQTKQRFETILYNKLGQTSFSHLAQPLGKVRDEVIAFNEGQENVANQLLASVAQDSVSSKDINPYQVLETMLEQTNGTNQESLRALIKKDGVSLLNTIEDILPRGMKADGLVYDSLDVSKSTPLTAEQIDKLLAGTAMQNLGSAFKKAEQTYGVNALFLTGLAIHESDFGRSRIAKDKNNLFGYQAYDHDPYHSAKQFSTFEEGIQTVAAHISNNYLRGTGRYYQGKSMDAINQNYATSKTWADHIKKRIQALFS